MADGTTQTRPASQVNPVTVESVYGVLVADCASHGGVSHLSSRGIAERLDVSDRTVRRALNVLQASGQIVMPKRRMAFQATSGRYGWAENTIVVVEVATGPVLGRAFQEKAAIEARHERYVAAGRSRSRRPRESPAATAGPQPADS